MSDCKLCALLGATISSDILENDGNAKTHHEVHARQLDIINSSKLTLRKTWTGPNGLDTGAENRHTPNQKSMKSVLNTFCRDLIKTHGKDCTFKCSQCRTTIQSAKVVKLINHASIHLSKHLFACKRCDLKFVTRSGIRDHCQRIHMAGYMRENYIDMTEDNQSDILDMVKLCFSKAPKKQMNVTAYGMQKRNNQRSEKFVLFWRELVHLRGKSSDIKCSQCSSSIRPRRDASYTAAQMIIHACIHLNKDLFGCRHCDLKFVSQTGIVGHLRRVHALSGIGANYIDMTKDNQGDIMDMVSLCFGEAPKKQMNVTAFGKQKRNYPIRVKDPLSELAYSFIAKTQHGGKIQCHLCPKTVPYNRTPPFVSYKLIDHARWHGDKPTFICNLCECAYSTKNTIRDHLKVKHHVAGSQKNFKDGSTEIFEETLSMLEHCFGENRERPPVVNKDQERARAKERNLRRHALANELIKKHATGGKIICRICSNGTNVYQKYFLFNHAGTHLDRTFWPYRCKLCSHMSSNRQNIHNHLQELIKRKARRNSKIWKTSFTWKSWIVYPNVTIGALKQVKCRDSIYGLVSKWRR